MKERIKFVRKHAKLTQADFAKRIGVSQSTVAGYENGVNTPRKSVIHNICREFHINFEWLESGGNSPFFSQSEDSILLEILSDLKNHPEKNEPIINILKKYWSLSESDKETTLKIINSFLK